MCSVHLYEEEWMEQHLEQRQRLLHSGHKLTRHLLKGVVGSSRPFHTDDILAKKRYVCVGAGGDRFNYSLALRRS